MSKDTIYISEDEKKQLETIVNKCHRSIWFKNENKDKFNRIAITLWDRGFTIEEIKYILNLVFESVYDDIKGE